MLPASNDDIFFVEATDDIALHVFVKWKSQGQEDGAILVVYSSGVVRG